MLIIKESGILYDTAKDHPELQTPAAKGLLQSLVEFTHSQLASLEAGAKSQYVTKEELLADIKRLRQILSKELNEYHADISGFGKPSVDVRGPVANLTEQQMQELPYAQRGY